MCYLEAHSPWMEGPQRNFSSDLRKDVRRHLIVTLWTQPFSWRDSYSWDLFRPEVEWTGYPHFASNVLKGRESYTVRCWWVQSNSSSFDQYQNFWICNIQEQSMLLNTLTFWEITALVRLWYWGVLKNFCFVFLTHSQVLFRAGQGCSSCSCLFQRWWIKCWEGTF